MVGGLQTYLSFHVGAIDPGQAPGTGRSEVGGLFTWRVTSIPRRPAGMDPTRQDPEKL